MGCGVKAMIIPNSPCLWFSWIYIGICIGDRSGLCRWVQGIGRGIKGVSEHCLWYVYVWMCHYVCVCVCVRLSVSISIAISIYTYTYTHTSIPIPPLLPVYLFLSPLLLVHIWMHLGSVARMPYSPYPARSPSPPAPPPGNIRPRQAAAPKLALALVLPFESDLPRRHSRQLWKCTIL